jgi:hypothetical protein
MSFTEPTHNLSGACICGHTGRKHHARGHAHAFTCSLCSCLYFEVAPIEEERPVYEQVADAIRCTSHIHDRMLRGRYVVADLQTRGYVLQRVVRDERGRFVGGAA